MKKLSKSDMKKLVGALAPTPGCDGSCYYYEWGRIVYSVCGMANSPWGWGCMCLGSTDTFCPETIDP